MYNYKWFTRVGKPIPWEGPMTRITKFLHKIVEFLTEGVALWTPALAIVVFTACGDSGTTPTEMTIEEAESFEFSATAERTAYLAGVVAAHNPGIVPQPEDFSYLESRETGTSSAPAHSMGIDYGFGGLVPGETLTFEYSLLWVNGETANKPFLFTPMVAASLYWISGSGELAEKVSNIVFTTQRISSSRYRVEFKIPMAQSGRFNLHLVFGMTVQCRTEGMKSFLVRDIDFSGAGFMATKMEGAVLFNGACRKQLPQYSFIGS